MMEKNNIKKKMLHKNVFRVKSKNSKSMTKIFSFCFWFYIPRMWVCCSESLEVCREINIFAYNQHWKFSVWIHLKPEARGHNPYKRLYLHIYGNFSTAEEHCQIFKLQMQLRLQICMTASLGKNHFKYKVKFSSS